MASQLTARVTNCRACDGVYIVGQSRIGDARRGQSAMAGTCCGDCRARPANRTLISWSVRFVRVVGDWLAVILYRPTADCQQCSWSGSRGTSTQFSWYGYTNNVMRMLLSTGDEMNASNYVISATVLQRLLDAAAAAASYSEVS